MSIGIRSVKAIVKKGLADLPKSTSGSCQASCTLIMALMLGPQQITTFRPQILQLNFDRASLLPVAALFNELDDEPPPSGLVTRANSRAIVPMKILVKNRCSRASVDRSEIFGAHHKRCGFRLLSAGKVAQARIAPRSNDATCRFFCNAESPNRFPWS
jgi:hypothetical protein